MMITRRSLSVSTAAIFFRQMAAMVAAGVPVKDALSAVAEDNIATTPLAVGYAGEGITEKGRTDFFKRVFNYLETNKAPNKAVSDALYKVAEEIDKSREFNLALSQIFFIPFMTLMVACVVLAVMLIFVIPVWEDLFSSMKGQLPFATQTVIDISRMIGGYAYIILPLMLIAGGLLIVNRNVLVSFASVLPMFRRLFAHYSMVRFTRYLSMLLHIDMPVKDAAALAAEEVRHRAHARQIRQAIAEISDRATLSRQLQSTGFISAVVGRIIDTGESSGTLASTLNDISVLYEKEADIALARAVYWFDIIIKLIVGAIVGTIVIAMYLPIFSLAGAVS